MAPSSGKLLLTAKDRQTQEYVISEGTVSLGRAAINDIVLDDDTVSRCHARIEGNQSGFVIIDQESANGTKVNGVRTARKTLAHGDEIQLGSCLLRFETGSPPADPESTQFISEADLETALRRETLPAIVRNTRETTIAVHVSGKTFEVPFLGDVLTIGRHPDNNIVLDIPQASRNHARIERSRDSFIVRDLNSRNGTRINGRKIDLHTLQDGETVQIGTAQLVFKKGFVPEELTSLELTSPARTTEPRPIVVVPGLAGSELWIGEERIWPNVKYLLSRSEIAKLPGDERIEARGLTQEVVIIPNLVKLDQYNRLGNYLEEELGYERGKNLLEFAYDWRRDCRISARRLALAIEEWQAAVPEARRPVIIIAHSLGSLVSRYYVQRLGGDKRVGRILFLGAPHYGVPMVIPTLLFGPDLLPFGLFGEKLRGIITTFESVYQILPTYVCTADEVGEPINVLLDECWVSEAQRPLLREGRSFRQELGSGCPVPSVSVFGHGLKTVTAVKARRSPQKEWLKADVISEAAGDAVIPEKSAMLKGCEIHPVRQYHGVLYTDNDVKMRLKTELTRESLFRSYEAV